MTTTPFRPVPTSEVRRRRTEQLLVHATRLAELGRRSRQVLVLAGLTGVLTGATVAAFEWITAEQLLHRVLGLPPVAAAGLPAVGLVLSWLALRWMATGASPSTADDYIKTFHDSTRRLDTRPILGRLVASVATLGFGGSLGYEGPALYAGAAIGSTVQRRLQRFFTAEDAKVLLVAGAAAGVSAIFKAPVTGLVFALEVPYQQDLARHMLLPAAISSAASYVTFAAFAGTAPILPVAGFPPFDLVDLGGAAVIGLACGVLARLFVTIVGMAKRYSTGNRPLARAVGGGLALGALFLAGWALTGQNQTLGPGYDTLRYALEQSRPLWLIVAVGTLRVLSTAVTVGGGGAGGLFVPLVIQGALVGRVASGFFGSEETTLFPVLGIAAFLGAGYRVPLAAVVFVAEFTGRPGFVVPGLVAAVVAQLVMGRASASAYQASGRAGHLERRMRLPLSAVVDTEARTVPSDATVEELFWHHLVGDRQRSVAVVDGDRYRGIASVDEVALLARDRWETTTVEEVARLDVPAVAPDGTVRDAMLAMEEAETDRLAVVDGEQYVGVITSSDVVRLDDVLDRLPDLPAT